MDPCSPMTRCCVKVKCRVQYVLCFLVFVKVTFGLASNGLKPMAKKSDSNSIKLNSKIQNSNLNKTVSWKLMQDAYF